MTVIDEVAAERKRQIKGERFDTAHDDEHTGNELALAAGSYTLHAAGISNEPNGLPKWWPWATKWWKPKDKRRDLIRAAALIVAEIERLDRQQLHDQQQDKGQSALLSPPGLLGKTGWP